MGSSRTDLRNQAIGPGKNLFGVAMKAQWRIQVHITRIQVKTTAQRFEHGADVAPLDQVLQGADVPAMGQVGHVEDHGGP